MKRVQFKYSNHAWGFNKEELYVIDFERKLYAHFDKGQLDDHIPLPDDLLKSMQEYFEKIYVEFPKDVFAYDAPMWTLTIDDKTCTRIADRDMDSQYKALSELFEKIKNGINEGEKRKMIILNNMYTGRYITQQGKLGHEIINLFKADDGKFYIWLNSMGICTRAKVDDSTLIMLRSVNSHMYKVLAKAENCKLCEGAKISRDKGNKNDDLKMQRYNAQKKLNVTYNGKCPMDDIFDEKDMFATFSTDKVLQPKGDIYITNDKLLEDIDNGIYYADFKISEAMRAYITENNSVFSDLNKLLTTSKVKWENVENLGVSAKPNFNFFKLLRKDKDELSFSNALAYFIENTGVNNFIDGCLKLSGCFKQDTYQLLREKNNIDISFFGEENVIIIENKIDAAITVDKRITIESQIKKAVELYFPDSSDEEKKNYILRFTKFIGTLNGDTSQLSKYYLYAIAYLMSKGIDDSQWEKRIKCFLLIPRYAKKQFKVDKNNCYSSNFLYSDKYEIITYLNIYNYFEPIKLQPYLDEFKSALIPLMNEFNNEIEEDCKYRFFKAIGKI